MRQRPFIQNCGNENARRCARGFSLVEMLVALAIGLLLLAAALSLALASRKVLDTDRVRTTLNQNLRSGMDLIGFDVRQAGERLPADVPALEIVNGASGAPDSLIVRRNLMDQVLPLCQDISAGSTASQIVVALGSGTIPPGCGPVPDTDGDGFPDNMGAWRDYREAGGGSVWAYIYSPATRLGETFLYYSEDETVYYLEKANGDAWQNDYNVTDQSRIYILEQHEFQLNGDVLRIIINEVDGNPYNLVDGITNLQARAFMQDGSVQQALGPADAWADIQSIEISLQGSGDLGGKDMDRELITHFFPRNVLSR